MFRILIFWVSLIGIGVLLGLLINPANHAGTTSLTAKKGEQEARINQAIAAHNKPDARTRVVNSLEWPYQAVVHLLVKYEEERWFSCTGFSVAPKVVLTARHCLKNPEVCLQKLKPCNEMAQLVEVAPAVNGQYMPFQILTSTRFQVSASGQDYGVIFLPNLIPTAHFSLKEFPHHAESADMVTAGYPGDKDASTMWESKYHDFVYLNKKLGVISGGVSFHGQSGSPLFQVEGRRFVAEGILWGGTACDEHGVCPQERVTYFVPFTDRVLREIRMWIAMSE
nr:trypsin-like serine protease [Shimazuella soli]